MLYSGCFRFIFCHYLGLCSVAHISPEAACMGSIQDEDNVISAVVTKGEDVIFSKNSQHVKELCIVCTRGNWVLVSKTALVVTACLHEHLHNQG